MKYCLWFIGAFLFYSLVLPVTGCSQTLKFNNCYHRLMGKAELLDYHDDGALIDSLILEAKKKAPNFPHPRHLFFLIQNSIEKENTSLYTEYLLKSIAWGNQQNNGVQNSFIAEKVSNSDVENMELAFMSSSNQKIIKELETIFSIDRETVFLIQGAKDMKVKNKILRNNYFCFNKIISIFRTNGNIDLRDIGITTSEKLFSVVYRLIDEPSFRNDLSELSETLSENGIFLPKEYCLILDKIQIEKTGNSLCSSTIGYVINEDLLLQEKILIRPEGGYSNIDSIRANLGLPELLFFIKKNNLNIPKNYQYVNLNSACEE